MNKATHVEISPEEAGQKLFQFLARRLPGAPKSLLMRLIRTGQVRIDGRRAKPFDRLGQGQIVRIPPCRVDCEPDRPLPENLEPVILFEDQELIAVVKPAGLPVHGGSGHADSLRDRLIRSRPNAPFPPTPAHRLDRDTSGLVLFAKSFNQLRFLQEEFKQRRVEKYYLAWVHGKWPHQDRIMMEDLLSKQGKAGQEKVRPGKGKRGLAEVAPLTVKPRASLLLIRLLTGRTHQLRVQLQTRGHPIVGDRKYRLASSRPEESGPMLLHAYALAAGGREFRLAPDWSGQYGVDESVLFSPPSPESEPPHCGNRAGD